MSEFEQALDRLSHSGDGQDHCLKAARQLMATLQALINRLRVR